jgi:hypothetical protein
MVQAKDVPADLWCFARSGHLVAYDNSAKWMMVSHGVNWRGELMDDTWTFDLVTGAWTRVNYAPGSLRAPKGGLAAFVDTGTVLFSIGGISADSALVGHSDVWALLTSTLQWKRVAFDHNNTTHSWPTATSQMGTENTWENHVRPIGRTQAVAVKLDAFGGLLEPVLVLGGRQLHAADGIPLDDIWVFDSVPLADVPADTSSTGSPPTVQDSMASFDGELSGG